MVRLTDFYLIDRDKVVILKIARFVQPAARVKLARLALAYCNISGFS